MNIEVVVDGDALPDTGYVVEWQWEVPEGVTGLMPVGFAGGETGPIKLRVIVTSLTGGASEDEVRGT